MKKIEVLLIVVAGILSLVVIVCLIYVFQTRNLINDLSAKISVQANQQQKTNIPVQNQNIPQVNNGNTNTAPTNNQNNSQPNTFSDKDANSVMMGKQILSDMEKSVSTASDPYYFYAILSDRIDWNTNNGVEKVYVETMSADNLTMARYQKITNYLENNGFVSDDNNIGMGAGNVSTYGYYNKNTGGICKLTVTAGPLWQKYDTVDAYAKKLDIFCGAI